MSRWGVAVLIMSLSACVVPLTEGGTQVRYKTKDEAPPVCKEIGEVEIRGYRMVDIKNRMRNKTSEMGGNLLVVDAIEGKDEGGFVGTGRAYSCPRSS